MKNQIPEIHIPKIDFAQINTAANLAQQMSQQITAQHQAMIQQMARVDITPLIEAAKIDLTPLVEASKIDLSGLTRATEALSNMARLIETSHIEEMLELSIRIQEEEDENEKIMLESGWYLSPTMMDVPYSLVKKAFTDYKDGDANAFFNLVRKVFRYKRFETLTNAVTDWKKSSYFKGRENILEQAIKAHKRGEYATAITTMITQIEGIAGEYCSRNPNVKLNISSKDGKRKVLTALKDKGIDESLIYQEAVINTVESILFANTENPKYKGIVSDVSAALNRHAILHGSITGFATEANSYKCILLLDVLSKLK